MTPAPKFDDGFSLAEKVIAITAGAAMLIGGFVRFWLTPKIQKLVWKTLDEDEDARAVFRRLVASACTEQNSAFARIAAEQASSIVRALEQSETNADKIAFVEAAVEAQGKSLSTQITAALEANAHTNEHIADSGREMTRLMGEMNKQLGSHGELLGRMDERIKAWDGIDRRFTNRRND